MGYTESYETALQEMKSGIKRRRWMWYIFPQIQNLGHPDDLKLKSCMTLFWLVAGDQLFQDVLDKFYGGKLDGRTKVKLP